MAQEEARDDRGPRLVCKKYGGERGDIWRIFERDFTTGLDARWADPGDHDSLGDAVRSIDQGGDAVGAVAIPGGNGGAAARAREKKRQQTLYLTIFIHQDDQRSCPLHHRQQSSV